MNIAIVIVLAAGLLALLATRTLITLLRRAAILDRPNERSSHAVPTPRGGGIAVIGAILLAWCAIFFAKLSPSPFVFVAGAMLLGIVSWLDDLRGLPPAPRFGAQIIAVALGSPAIWVGISSAGPVFQGVVPVWLDGPLAALLWLWFINLFNFMDGIDGLAGSEAASVGIGLAFFWAIPIADPGSATQSAAIAAAALGFLVWNWAPARIFLGNVGSIPLGYLLGLLLLYTAANGHWKIALILPLYFLADATLTLLRRLVRGERVWQAHREHFYQRAVQRGLSHAAVTRRVVAANLLLIVLGWAAENGLGFAAVVLAFVVVALLLADLTGLLPFGARPIHPANPAIEEPPPR